jgi:hypothetical protein
MAILEVEGPDDTLFQQEGPLPYFHKEVTDCLNRKFPERNGLAGAAHQLATSRCPYTSWFCIFGVR